MESIIENEFLLIKVKDFGAELHSLKTKSDGVEHLWQPDPNIWSGQSPILFPIVGRLLNDTYELDGKHYELPKHGFARRSPFSLINNENNALVYSLKSNDQAKEIYPYNFELQVSYTLENASLNINHSIINNNDGDMYFSIGAHPAFNCEIGDIIEFEQMENIFREYIDEEGIIIPEKHHILNNSNIIEITENLFDRDALILTDYKSTKVYLRTKSLDRTIEVSFGNAPYLGIWAKPGAKYVCIEPWYGISDNYGHNHDLSKKRGIVKLEKAGVFNFSYSITIQYN